MPIFLHIFHSTVTKRLSSCSRLNISLIDQAPMYYISSFRIIRLLCLPAIGAGGTETVDGIHTAFDSFRSSKDRPELFV